MKRLYLVMMVSFLAACQSIPTKPAAFQNDLTPKAQVASALQASLKSSFGYTTQIQLAYQAKTQVYNTTHTHYDCDGKHDEDYVVLARRAVEEGFDISSDRYLDDRQVLKDDYLLCIRQRQQLPDEFSDEFVNAIISGDSHKQAAIEAYWLKPSRFGFVGNYQPIQGVISILPSIQYQMGQVALMANQPIYIDMRTGDVYLWADNFALANATWLDKSLGNQWHNKWLKLSLNDGSLPDGFHQAMIRAYLSAYRTAFDGLDDGQFEYVSADELVWFNDLGGRLDSAVTIIRYQSNATQTQAQRQRVLQLFYDAMLADYPMLDKEDSSGNSVDENGTERITITAKTLMQTLFAYIKSKAWVETPTDLSVRWEDKSRLDIAQTKLDGDKQDAAAQVVTKAAARVKPSKNDLYNKAKQSATDDEQVTRAVDDVLERGSTAVYYGLNHTGRLLWVYRVDDGVHNAYTKPMTITSLTSLHSLHARVFDRLPSHAATPNHQNTIDVLSYGNQLLNDSDSHGMMLQVLLAILNPIEAPTETQSVEIENLPEPNDSVSNDKPSQGNQD